jgi:hypothetical protein
MIILKLIISTIIFLFYYFNGVLIDKRKTLYWVSNAIFLMGGLLVASAALYPEKIHSGLLVSSILLKLVFGNLGYNLGAGKEWSYLGNTNVMDRLLKKITEVRIRGRILKLISIVYLLCLFFGFTLYCINDMKKIEAMGSMIIGWIEFVNKYGSLGVMVLIFLLWTEVNSIKKKIGDADIVKVEAFGQTKMRLSDWVKDRDRMIYVINKQLDLDLGVNYPGIITRNGDQ